MPTAGPGPKAPFGSSRQGRQALCPGHLSSPRSATHTHSTTTFSESSLQHLKAEARGTPFPAAISCPRPEVLVALWHPAAHTDVALQRCCPQLLLSPVGVSQSAAQRQSTEASALPSHLPLLPPLHGNQQSLIIKYF